MAALGINIGYLVMQILLFLILMMVLRNYLYEPVINALEERKAKIAKENSQGCFLFLSPS